MKKTLYEVSIIRPVVIFLLVVLHAFIQLEYPSPSSDACCKNLMGGGDYQHVTYYYWMLKLIQGFRIETITFIAGYVFAFQSIDLGKKYVFKQFFIKKFNRLVIPYFVFGLIYFFAFVYNHDFSWNSFLLSSYPVGHLWFLPMLFWVFLVLWAYDKYYNTLKYSFFAIMLLSAIPIFLPLNIIGLMRLPHFVFYCLFGYEVYRNKDEISKKLLNKVCIVTAWFIYVILVVLYFSLLDNISMENSTYMKLAVSALKILVRLIICCSGISAIYLTVLKVVSQADFKPSKFVLTASSLCYGVYVYHQFILQMLNRYVPLSDYVGYYLLPWIGLLITLFLSIGVTRITLKSQIGQRLIG